MRDLVIIGAGPGGFDTAIYAKEQGLDVVLIEKNKVGGTCLNWGCIPTKALYHNATMIKQIHELDVFGIKVDQHKIDYDVIKTRKEAIVSNQINHIKTSLSKSKIELIQGEATITGPHQVTVNGTTIDTNHIIIATGSTVRRIRFEGDDLPVVHDSKELLELTTWPKQMIVVGAGVIGTEMASIFQQFGCDITLVEYQDAILPPLDKDIKKRARNLFKRSGMTIHTSSSLSKVYEENGTYKAVIQSKKGELVLDTDYILLATGRQPHIGNLPLEELGIDADASGIHVDENKQTSIDSIYAIGDVNGELMLAHKATYDGYKAVDHILKKERNIRFDLVPSVVFSIPEIATIGQTEDELEGLHYRTNKYLYKTNAKAECMNETDGFIKMIVDEQGTIIGCHIIGAHAADLIHEVAGLMYKDITVQEYKNIIHAHPTLAEIIGECIKGF